MTTIQSWHDAERSLAAAWPGFASRPQQRRMAEAVQLTLRGESAHPTLLVQAGCGVGKSLAYLVPAIAEAVRRDTRVVVSVSTKALQDQLSGKDLPALRDSLFPGLTFAVLKGRSNYVCHRAAAQHGLTVSVAEGSAGERQDLIHPVDDQAWREMTTDAEGCIGRKRCPFGKECYSESARQAALRARVLVVNTSLLTQDLRLRAMTDGKAGLLGEYGALIVDEAHEMPSIVADGLTRTVTLGRILDTLSRLEDHLEEDGPARVRAAQDEAVSWFSRLQAWFEANDRERSAELDQDDHAASCRLSACLADLNTLVQDARCACPDPDPDPFAEDDSERVCEFARRTDNLAQDVSTFDLEPGAGWVAWVQTGRGGRVELKSAPVEVGGFLHSAVWSRGLTAVLTSATLGMNGDVTYIARRCGLAQYDSMDAGSPFDYAAQARLLLPLATAPSPKDRDDWLPWSQDQMLQLVEASNGGALLLFTSTSAMRQAHEALSPRLSRDFRLSCLLQGGDVSNRELGRRFQADRDSVLFATRSFMTGVDFAGDTCRLVVIDKMPFPVPDDPIFKARCALTVERFGKGSDFRRVSIPEMSLVLVQAFGRLIRTVDDFGAVAILDPRMRAGWASAIRRALPPAPVVDSVSDVQTFYAQRSALAAGAVSR